MWVLCVGAVCGCCVWVLCVHVCVFVGVTHKNGKAIKNVPRNKVRERKVYNMSVCDTM